MLKKTKSKKSVQQKRSLDDEWKQYKNNPHIQKNKVSKEFRCLTCNLHLSDNQGGAGNHSTSEHKISLSGDPVKVKTTNGYSNKDSENTLNKTQLESEIEGEIQQRQQSEEQEHVIEPPESIILRGFYKDIAKSVAKIGRDIELQFEYERLKSENRIPFDWDFHTWIKRCVMLYNHIFKIHVELTQDLKSLPDHLLKWQQLVYYENVEFDKDEGM